MKDFRLCRSTRKRGLFSAIMCFDCLRVGHFTKDCKRKVTCNICKQIHPTPLHKEQFKTKGAETIKKEKASTALYYKRANNSNHISMVIPVRLSCVKAESPEYGVCFIGYSEQQAIC